jgi:hypothetical protein
MRRIFLDMDGVLADFDGFFESTFGIATKDVTKKEMWNAIHWYDEFFYNLPMMEGAMKLYVAALANVELNTDVYVLTSAGSSNFMHVAEQKKRWIQKHIDHNVTVIAVREGADKAAMVQNKGDILVDDWRKNCEAWEAVGGLAVKYENATQAIADLEGLLYNKEAA